MTETTPRPIPRNTLLRSSLTLARFSAEDSLAQPSTCRHCGGPLPPAKPTGRPRLYCSPDCRQAAAEHRRVAAQMAWADAELAAQRYARHAPDATERTCARCGRTLPLDAFPPARSTRDGRSSWCTDCKNAATRRWRAEHRDTLNAARRDAGPRYCAVCGATLAKLPGPGRWPRYCAEHRLDRAEAERKRRRARPP